MTALDLDCFNDLDQFAGELTDPIDVLVQDVIHMLIERPGSNLDNTDRGAGIIEALSGAVDPTLASRIDAMLQDDDRIDVAETTIQDQGSGAFQISISVHTNNQVLNLVFVNNQDGFQLVSP